MPYNGKKVVEIAISRGLKAKDFRSAVFPNRTGNFSWDEVKKSTNPEAVTIEATADFLQCSIDELFDRPSYQSASSSGDHIEANDNSTAFKGYNTCDSRLLGIIESRDRQLEKAQSQIDRLMKLLESVTKN